MFLGKCGSCGSEVESGSKFCIKCGASTADRGDCPACGAVNLPEAEYCASCGSKLKRGNTLPKSTDDINRIWSTTGGSQAPPEDLSCPRCGRPILTTDWVCPHCSYELVETEGRSTRNDSSIPIVVGILLLIASVLNIVSGLVIGSVVSIMPTYGFCGAIMVLIGIVIFPGALAAMKRKHFGPVLVVSVLALISVGPCFICSLLGLIALVGLAAAHKEFDERD